MRTSRSSRAIASKPTQQRRWALSSGGDHGLLIGGAGVSPTRRCGSHARTCDQGDPPRPVLAQAGGCLEPGRVDALREGPRGCPGRRPDRSCRRAPGVPSGGQVPAVLRHRCLKLLAIPSSSSRMASASSGNSIRLTMNPGRSAPRTAVLPGPPRPPQPGEWVGVTRLERADDLHQRHGRHGVPGVHPDDPRPALDTDRIGQPADGDGAGVGCQHRRRRRRDVQLPRTAPAWSASSSVTASIARSMPRAPTDEVVDDPGAGPWPPFAPSR